MDDLVKRDTREHPQPKKIKLNALLKNSARGKNGKFENL